MRTLTAILTLALLTLTATAGAEQADYRYEGVPRIVAVGDVHGDYHQLVSMLERAAIIGPERQWDAGPAHLVVTGDMVDRGPDSRRVMDFLMRLQEEAGKQGGRVHALLGNHEVMWLTGDFEYVSEADYRSFVDEESQAAREAARKRFDALKAAGNVRGDFDERFPPGAFGLREALSPDGRYGRWLMERPVVVVINGTAFIHAGLSREYAGVTAAEINRRVHDQLRALIGAWNQVADAGIVAPEYPMLNAARGLEAYVDSGAFDDQPREAMTAIATLSRATRSPLFDPDGPLWYRGNATCNAMAETAVVERALEGLRAERMVISHTPTPDGRVSARMNGRLIRIDTGERKSALVIEPDGERVLYADSEQPAPITVEDRHPVANLDMSPAEIESFLLEADVVAMEDVGTGVTNPQRVTLEKDGIRMRAVFKSEATPTRATGGLSSRRIVDIADRHVYELAAYRLDRLLGLNMVPPAVERRIGRETGTLQYWVEDATNERERRNQDIEPDGSCPLAKDYALLELFDRLIYNTDRTQENILYLPDWRVALIDHTRAFRTTPGKPDTVRHVSLDEAPAFARRLESLDRGALNEALGDVLDNRQIRAILQRRDEMLAEWRSASPGEIASR